MPLSSELAEAALAMLARGRRRRLRRAGNARGASAAGVAGRLVRPCPRPACWSPRSSRSARRTSFLLLPVRGPHRACRARLADRLAGRARAASTFSISMKRLRLRAAVLAAVRLGRADRRRPVFAGWTGARHPREPEASELSARRFREIARVSGWCSRDIRRNRKARGNCRPRAACSTRCSPARQRQPAARPGRPGGAGAGARAGADACGAGTHEHRTGWP